MGPLSENLIQTDSGVQYYFLVGEFILRIHESNIK